MNMTEDEYSEEGKIDESIFQQDDYEECFSINHADANNCEDFKYGITQGDIDKINQDQDCRSQCSLTPTYHSKNSIKGAQKHVSRMSFQDRKSLSVCASPNKRNMQKQKQSSQITATSIGRSSLGSLIMDNLENQGCPITAQFQNIFQHDNGTTITNPDDMYGNSKLFILIDLDIMKNYKKYFNYQNAKVIIEKLGRMKKKNLKTGRKLPPISPSKHNITQSQMFIDIQRSSQILRPMSQEMSKMFTMDKYNKQSVQKIMSPYKQKSLSQYGEEAINQKCIPSSQILQPPQEINRMKRKKYSNQF